MRRLRGPRRRIATSPTECLERRQNEAPASRDRTRSTSSQRIAPRRSRRRDRTERIVSLLRVRRERRTAGLREIAVLGSIRLRVGTALQRIYDVFLARVVTRATLRRVADNRKSSTSPSKTLRAAADERGQQFGTRTPPVEAHRPVVTRLQFPLQVGFPCTTTPSQPQIRRPYRARPVPSPSDNLVKLIVV